MTTSTQPKARVPQAVRSAKMRDRLTQAAFNVIREVGFASFRTSAVSKEAGVSQGAQLHHFPTKDSLAIAAMEYAYSKSGEQSELNFNTPAKDGELVDLILTDFKDFFLSDYFRVALDILMGGSKHEDLRQELVDMAIKNRGRVERCWLEKLVDDGWSLVDAEDFLSTAHNLVRGFAIRSLVDPNTDEFDRLLERWKKQVLDARERQS